MSNSSNEKSNEKSRSSYLVVILANLLFKFIDIDIDLDL